MMPEMVETKGARTRRDAGVLLRENRILMAVCFFAVVLLGPSFIGGYMYGRKTAADDVRLQESIASAANSVGEDGGASKPAKAGSKAKAKARTVATAGPAQSALHGTYLQLAAVPDDQSYIERLRADGFEAVAMEIPAKPGLYRVLVGPLEDGAVDQTRAELENKGLPGKSAIARVF